VFKAVKAPVIGLGGIETASDVLEYMAVGASCVQVGTASFTDPRASERLVSELPKAFFRAKVFTVNEIRGIFNTENG